MDINVTLFGQMITFAIFIWFTMKFVWPFITSAINSREKQMADGLAAAEQGKRDLELAAEKTQELLVAAKEEAAGIIDQANTRAGKIVDEAREAGREEGKRMVASAQAEIEQQYVQAKTELQNNTTELAVKMAEKIVMGVIDQERHKQLLSEVTSEIH